MRLHPKIIFCAGLGLAMGLLLGSPGCRPPAKPAAAGLNPDQVSGSNALAEVQALASIRPRVAGTPGARQAAEHLAARLKALGIETTLDVFEDKCPGGPATFRNVLGVFPAQPPETGWGERLWQKLSSSADQPAGSGRGWVVLGAHYDTKSGISATFEGANDAASGAGLILELARLIKAGGALPFNVLVAFFDGEECRRHYGPQDGLHGSRRLAKTLLDDGRALNVRAVIVLDMVGDKNLQLTLPRNGTPRLLTAVFRAAEADGARDKFSLYATEILDDHQPFFEAGMPAVDIIDYEFGSAPGKNDYWHTPADTLDKLSAASLTVVGRVVVRMLNDLAAEPGQER
jgi:glutaminyl-peptide cyclotransferase